MISTGKAAARELTHARMLLKADQSQERPDRNESHIQKILETSTSTVQRVRNVCTQHRMQEAMVPQSVQQAHCRLDRTSAVSTCSCAATPLVVDTRDPLPFSPGKSKWEDDAHERYDVYHLCVSRALLLGTRVTILTPHPGKQEWNEFIRHMMNSYTSDSEQIVIVIDQILAALSETFPATKARRLCQGVEVQSTSKHASWLHMAEMERSVLDWPGVLLRLASLEMATQQTAVWTPRYNQQQVTLRWRFPTADASSITLTPPDPLLKD